MDLIVKGPHSALWGASEFRCAIGENGLVLPHEKKEGDKKTPLGRWPMREVLYRADRIAKIATALPHRAMNQNDAWCEVPDDENYNRLVRLPYKTMTDHMWRDDHLYDVVVVLGYNDDPVKPGAGSAIFMHLARPDYSPSAGCVTLHKDDLIKILREADRDSCVDIRADTCEA